ncbi:hypothetical protein PanWU01x14_122420 [Parasponia andersonii]|uniref:Uncharacterized protein n=1 Tax=Parasponia andersonii TaxID=3476 RepID=A0A2P5CUN1_PARAD|nr:hypothetical protein PanWU01x14_122420 [Parasponia andersonii]
MPSQSYSDLVYIGSQRQRMIYPSIKSVVQREGRLAANLARSGRHLEHVVLSLVPAKCPPPIRTTLSKHKGVVILVD